MNKRKRQSQCENQKETTTKNSQMTKKEIQTIKKIEKN